MKNQLPHHSLFHLSHSGQHDERSFPLSPQPEVLLTDQQMLEVWFEQTVPSLDKPSLFTGVSARTLHPFRSVSSHQAVTADYDDDYDTEEAFDDDYEEEEFEDDWDEEDDDLEDDWDAGDDDFEDFDDDDFEDFDDDYENEYEGMFEALSGRDDERSSPLKARRRFRDEEPEPRGRGKRKRTYRHPPRFNVENDYDAFDEEED